VKEATPPHADQAFIAALLPRLREGEKEAWASYYETFSGPLKAAAGRWLRRPEDAEDVTQDSLLKAIDALDSFDPEKGTFLNWLIGIARHKSLDRIRSLQRVHGLDVAEDVLSRLVDADRLEDIVVEAELRAHLSELLDQLSERQRTIVYLHHYRGLPYEQIFPRVGLTSADSARQYAMRARNKLAQLLLRDPNFVYGEEPSDV
jgi:RNA polymerase sigma-70 factor, ECF subfamily